MQQSVAAATAAVRGEVAAVGGMTRVAAVAAVGGGSRWWSVAAFDGGGHAWWPTAPPAESHLGVWIGSHQHAKVQVTKMYSALQRRRRARPLVRANSVRVVPPFWMHGNPLRISAISVG